MLPPTHADPVSAPVLKRLYRNPCLQIVFARAIGAYLALTIRTTRWECEGIEHLMRQAAAGSPLIIAFWHNRLPLMPTLWIKEQQLPDRQFPERQVHILVSRHRDGRLVGEVMRRFGVGLVHGSSSKGGASSLRKLLDLLRQRHYVVITPDGPRGPCQVAAPGVAQLAALSHAAILPCSAQTTRRLVLDTWDRMTIPKPFGRAILVCGSPILVDRQNWKSSLDTITAALNAASERADQLCQ